MSEAAAPVRNLPATARVSLVQKFASKFHIEEAKLLPILKATAFKQREGAAEVTNEQMAALLIVADQYGLNPFTREIFAFPDKQNGIVPVVSVDGWARILNEDAMFNGLEFRYSESRIEPGKLDGLKWSGYEWIEAVIYRKDRTNPIVVREYFEEVYRTPFKFDDGNSKEGPWQSHPKRMHRHKALIQCARLAMGFAGLFDEDEAHRIIDGQVLPTDPLPIDSTKGVKALNSALGVDTVADKKEKPAGTLEERDKLVGKMKACADVEILALARDEANMLAWTPADQQVIDDAFEARKAELMKAE